MTRIIILAATIVLIPFSGRPQGVFNFSNIGYAPTHIGSIDGPLAGTGIWAQMLAGPSVDGLAPVGNPVEHFDRAGVPTGWVIGGTVAVPGILPGQTAYVEMLAWDGTRWGTALADVPKDQLGMTDVVPVILTGLLGPPPPGPHFTQPAVVPVPEPSTLAIGVLAAAGTLVRLALRRRREPGSRSMPLRREEFGRPYHLRSAPRRLKPA